MSRRLTFLPVTPERPTAARARFACTSSFGVGAACIRVAGALDAFTSPRLVGALREAGLQTRLIALDLRQLTFLGASGVRAIVGASIRVRRSGRRLLLIAGPGGAHWRFALTGTVENVEVFELGPGEPSVQVLLQIARESGAVS